MGNLTGNTDKKTTITSKMIKQRKNTGTCWDKKEKSNSSKMTIRLDRINQKELMKEGRLKRYQDRVKQYRQNRTSLNNKKQFYRKVGRDSMKTYQQPDAREAKQFWSKIWQPREHNKKAKQISNMGKELKGLKEGPKAKIDIDLLYLTILTIKEILNWKTPGHDGIHRFWFKKFTSIHNRLMIKMNRCLQEANVPKWMTKGKTPLIHKDLLKGTAPNNYRPIMCLPIMWKILIAQIREEIYDLLTSCGLFLKEEKGCHKETRDTGKLIHTDQHILNESKMTWINLAKAWIDYKKVYDMIPQI